jgi:hypothetical protein
MIKQFTGLTVIAGNISSAKISEICGKDFR